MKVLARPKEAKNSYTSLLYRELEKHGIKVYPHNTHNIKGLLLNIDIFHFHWLNSFLKHNKFISLFKSLSFVFYIVILKLKGTKITWTLHNTRHSHNNNIIEKLLVNVLYKLSDNIIIHNTYQKQYIPKKYIKKVNYIYHHNYQPILSQTNNKKENYILYFGNISYYKGLDIAIKAYNEATLLNCDAYNFKIIGQCSDNNYYHYINNLIQKNYHNKICFINKFVSNDELEKLVKKASYVILPFRNITNSGSIIYALSCKKNIITSNNIVANDLLYNFSSLDAVVKTFYNYEQLVYILAYQLKDVENKQCFESFLKNTHITNLVDKYLQVYNS